MQKYNLNINHVTSFFFFTSVEQRKKVFIKYNKYNDSYYK